MHGHWTIEVRDPDGALKTHREFENSLTFFGPANLAAAMGRAATTGLWEVNAGNSTGGPCLLSNPVPCFVVESSDPLGTSNAFHTLTVSAPLSRIPMWAR